ncbi:MAG: site-2 protease family protein [Clostridia bacterium]|nr:site-2 protease family protein [Clostridia bacterium]
MQIKIDLKIFIVVLIFLLTRQLEVYCVIMLFAILHEFGHLITGMILGFKPRKIKILPVGVSACFYMNLKNYNEKVKSANILALKKIIIAISGPITNFIIAFVCGFFEISLFNISTEFIVFSNLLIGFFNLIPIYPLDGGRIVKSIIHIKVGLKKSYKYTYMLSNITIIFLTVISSIAILYLKNISILIILIYLWIMVIIENKRYNSKMNIYKLIENIDDNNECISFVEV